MSDLLEDQKIHYIVKDYRRMVEMHDELVQACKDATKELEKKDKKILSLEEKLTKKEKASTNVAISNISLIRDQLVSIQSRAQKSQQMLDDLIEVLKPSNSEEDTSNINV